MRSPGKLILILFFVALLATPFLISQFSQPRIGRIEAAAQRVERFGVSFDDVAAASGVDFKHTSPALDAKLENIRPVIASMGAGVSVVDFDRDGWNDLYLTNSGEESQNALYRNNRDGSFTDVAPMLGVGDVNRRSTGVSMGAVWGDYDNDGFEDLFLYKWGRPELFHNDGGSGFTRVSETAGMPAWINANTAIWLDYDSDGLLDLFVGGYFRENIDLWHIDTTLIMPDSFEYAKNGGRKYLFHNLGSGRFEEVSKQLGIDSNRWALAAVAADLRGTGYPDLFVANDYGVSELYLNDNGKRFIDSGEATGVGFAPKSGMNASFGDVMNTGRLAIYVSNISEPSILLQGNNLWVPRSDTADLRFENQADAFGVEFGGWSWGAQFGDLNNDGTQDLFLTNGFISGEKATNYWYDYAKVTVGNSSIIEDVRNWAPIGTRSLAGYQNKHVWLNDGAGHFNDVALMIGVDTLLDGRSVAMADLWNRGTLDVIVANQNGPACVYKATSDPRNNWIDLELEGTASNRTAIGAMVTLFSRGVRQVQVVQGGAGFASQNQRRLHFGLGTATNIEKVEIRWPSGKNQTITELSLNTLSKIKE